MDRPVANSARSPLYLCLLGASFAAAVAVVTFFAGGSSASAAEADADGPGTQGSVSSPVAALVSPIIGHVAASVEQHAAPDRDQAVDRVGAAVVAAVAPPVPPSVGEAVGAVVAAPLLADVGAPVVGVAQAPVLGDVSRAVVAVVAPVESVAGSALASVPGVLDATRVHPAPVGISSLPGGITASNAGAPLPAAYASEALGLSPALGIPAQDGSTLAPAVRSAAPRTGDLVPPGVLSEGHPPFIPFGDPGGGPGLPVAPPGPSGGNSAPGGGGNPCPSDLPGALAPPLLPGVRHGTAGETPAPASPAVELGSTPD
ncbi:hypothetical protein [Glaciibacter sp. 2TAF33]|uniref:hypothetical protein n=1 Tax=Glaciibacter sp. 2TAF33 TaxID=3233015 RepID=UPI003F8F5540